MKQWLLPIALVLVASQSFGCTTKRVVQGAPAETTPTTEDPAAEEEEETPAAPTTPAAPKPELFGEKLDSSLPVTSLDDMIKTPDGFTKKTIRTQGVIRQVCQKRGCWAELRSSSAREGQTMRMTFDGYSFFLPKDSRGASVTVEGKLSVLVLTPEQVEHYEAEGATFDNKKPDGSALSIEFVATGVEMTGRKK